VLLAAQEKYPEAIEQYRAAVRLGKSDSAVNNLAMLLALHDPKKADEAIRLMDELIGVRGPYPSFLDTRAVAYIVKGGDDVAKAVRDLEMALLQRYSPAYLFHLAVAYDLQGKRLERDRRIDEARKVGVTAGDAHPLELRKYRELFGPDAK
jgi:tetratricopeptide (TPR) repeat protein